MPFNFWGQNVNLSFHFNCTGVPDFAREIPCLSTSTNKSCVNDLNYEPENFSWTVYSCDDEVVTTVFDVFSSTMALETEFSRALRQGFELKWGRMEDCQKCEESGGRCGHNNSTTELMCFCSGGAITMGHCKGTFVETPRFMLNSISTPVKTANLHLPKTLSAVGRGKIVSDNLEKNFC